MKMPSNNITSCETRRQGARLTKVMYHATGAVQTQRDVGVVPRMAFEASAERDMQADKWARGAAPFGALNRQQLQKSYFQCVGDDEELTRNRSLVCTLGPETSVLAYDATWFNYSVKRTGRIIHNVLAPTTDGPKLVGASARRDGRVVPPKARAPEVRKEKDGTSGIRPDYMPLTTYVLVSPSPCNANEFSEVRDRNQRSWKFANSAMNKK